MKVKVKVKTNESYLWTDTFIVIVVGNLCEQKVFLLSSASASVCMLFNLHCFRRLSGPANRRVIACIYQIFKHMLRN